MPVVDCWCVLCAGLKPTVGAFFTFMFTVALVAYTATSMAMAISADQTVVAIANIFMTVTCVFMMVTYRLSLTLQINIVFTEEILAGSCAAVYSVYWHPLDHKHFHYKHTDSMISFIHNCIDFMACCIILLPKVFDHPSKLLQTAPPITAMATGV